MLSVRHCACQTSRGSNVRERGVSKCCVGRLVKRTPCCRKSVLIVVAPTAFASHLICTPTVPCGAVRGMVSQSARARKFAVGGQDRCFSLNLEPLHSWPIALRSLLHPTKDSHVSQPMTKAELHYGISFRQALVAHLDNKWVVTTREHVTKIGYSNVDSEFSCIFNSWHFRGFGSCRREL